jgi:Zn-finger nucleic acid-binding protein
MSEIQFPGRLHSPTTGQPITVIVDECASCQGIWFDRYELEATIGFRDYIQDLIGTMGQFSEAGFDCPACTFPLQAVQLADATFHVCRACHGCWLPSGVVRKLADFLQAQRVQLGGSIGSCQCARCQQSVPAHDVHFASPGPMCKRCFDVVLWNEHRVRQAPLQHDLELTDAHMGAAGAAGAYAAASFAEVMIEVFVGALIDN